MRQIKDIYLTTFEAIAKHPSEGVSIEIQFLKEVSLHSLIHLFNVLECILDTRQRGRPEDRRVKSSCCVVGEGEYMYIRPLQNKSKAIFSKNR